MARRLHRLRWQKGQVQQRSLLQPEGRQGPRLTVSQAGRPWKVGSSGSPERIQNVSTTTSSEANLRGDRPGVLNEFLDPGPEEVGHDERTESVP